MSKIKFFLSTFFLQEACASASQAEVIIDHLKEFVLFFFLYIYEIRFQKPDDTSGILADGKLWYVFEFLDNLMEKNILSHFGIPEVKKCRHVGVVHIYKQDPRI